MSPEKTIIFTVTNDLTYDQRMKRICRSLAAEGFRVILAGRKLKNSKPLPPENYIQQRLNCFFTRGKLFYLEYNLRLLVYLLFKKADCICAIDLDTILPCYLVSILKKTKRVYDAHEYFTEMEEVLSRPVIHRIWSWVERKMIPRFPNGYTVCQSIAEVFEHKYKVKYSIIRNTPLLTEPVKKVPGEKYILYQGAVNKGRSLNQLVKGMKNVPCPLYICGDGNYMTEIRRLVNEENLADKVFLTGMLEPADLKKMTAGACIAVNPFQRNGLNQYFSLANKFFDYIHAGIPQVTMNYPEYKRVNDIYEVGILVDEPVADSFSQALNKLLASPVLYDRLKDNCIKAREQLNWQQEEKKLTAFYKKI